MGLSEIHKSGVPLSPTYKLAKCLAYTLQFHVANTEHYVKNTRHLVQILSGMHLDKNDTLVTFRKSIRNVMTEISFGSNVTPRSLKIVHRVRWNSIHIVTKVYLKNFNVKDITCVTLVISVYNCTSHGDYATHHSKYFKIISYYRNSP